MSALLGAIGAVTVAFGAWLGHRLAARGLTARNALEGRQHLAWLLLAGVGAAFGVLNFRDRITEIAWLDPLVGMYVEETVWPLATAIVGLALGALLGLEWRGRSDTRRLRSLIGGTSVMVAGLGYIGWQTYPIADSLGPALMTDGVVIQSSAYTCAPASIATLMRLVGADTGASERKVARVAGTSREGTSGINELRAMKAFGLAPRFGRRLTVDSLIRVGRPAVLHVNEPAGAGTIRHAVALLEIDAKAGTVVLGNPLQGRQVKRFSELKGYWFGDAIFVGR